MAGLSKRNAHHSNAAQNGPPMALQATYVDGVRELTDFSEGGAARWFVVFRTDESSSMRFRSMAEKSGSKASFRMYARHSTKAVRGPKAGYPLYH